MRKEIKNSKLGKSNGPRSTAWKEQLSMIWSGWNTSYWRWEKAREETDRESIVPHSNKSAVNKNFNLFIALNI